MGRRKSSRGACARAGRAAGSPRGAGGGVRENVPGDRAAAGLAPGGEGEGSTVDTPLDEWLARAWVDRAVWDLRPDYRAALVAADHLVGGPGDEVSEKLLCGAIAAARERLAGRSPDELPHVRAWQEAYRAFGAKPQRTRPSVDALLRRIEAGIPRIDRLTDAYNAISISHLLPAGGEDLAAYAGPIRLVRADGTEDFDTVASGAPAVEHPAPGEVVWRDDLGVTCRRWNWRQCARTRLTARSTSAVFVLDGLAPVTARQLSAAARDLAAALMLLCPQARVASRLLAPPGAGE